MADNNYFSFRNGRTALPFVIKARRGGHGKRCRRLAIVASLLLAGCSPAPVYQRPALDIPDAFKEGSVEGTWKTAEPADAIPRGAWWQIFADPVLDDLEVRGTAANQDLGAALARLDQARAFRQNVHAGLLPQVTVGAGPTRQLSSAAALGLPAGSDSHPSTLWRAQVSIAYEADLFGRIRSAADAATAVAEQREALFHSLQLTIQADIAHTYFLLRELDTLAALYAATIELREQAVALLEKRLGAGDIGELDLARSRTELASARAEALGIARNRALAENSLALLLGASSSTFTMPARPLARIAPPVPPGLPSALLERRPDIAAAERAMAAANARIGEARAARFPRLSLTGMLGYEAAESGDLFKWGNRVFAMGPLVGTALTLPLFDGGARRAEVERADAAYREEVANYRQAVLRAFKEVDDGLARLRLLGEQIRVQDDALGSSDRAAALASLQYREGLVSHLNVIDADRDVLQQRRISVQLDTERVHATIDLIRAIGGGWESGSRTP